MNTRKHADFSEKLWPLSATWTILFCHSFLCYTYCILYKVCSCEVLTPCFIWHDTWYMKKDGTCLLGWVIFAWISAGRFPFSALQASIWNTKPQHAHCNMPPSWEIKARQPINRFLSVVYVSSRNSQTNHEAEMIIYSHRIAESTKRREMVAPRLPHTRLINGRKRFSSVINFRVRT
jgi:hypothetical protein